MADTIRITAALRISGSPDRVREQYRDIDEASLGPSIDVAYATLSAA